MSTSLTKVAGFRRRRNAMDKKKAKKVDAANYLKTRELAQEILEKVSGARAKGKQVQGVIVKI
jgi:hypothetical protein